LLSGFRSETNKGQKTIANALRITIAVLLAIGFTLMGELTFFIPFKIVIWTAYSAYILTYCGLLLANVFAAAFALNRKFLLKDPGLPCLPEHHDVSSVGTLRRRERTLLRSPRLNASEF
jgi:hypothetical protein